MHSVVTGRMLRVAATLESPRVETITAVAGPQAPLVDLPGTVAALLAALAKGTGGLAAAPIEALPIDTE